MAQKILWFAIIISVITSILFHFNGEEVEQYTKVVVLVSVSVLAICESIEKAKE